MNRSRWSAVCLLAACLAPLAHAADPVTPPPSATPIDPGDAPALYTWITEGWDPKPDEIPSAEATLSSAKIAQPSDARWPIALAVLQRHKGDAKGSVEALKAIAKAHPKNADARFQLGQSYMGTITRDSGFVSMAGIAGDAKEAWEDAVEVDPNHIWARYALSQYELQARKQGGWLFGSYGKARKHAEVLLALRAGNGPFWGNVALGAIDGAEEKWTDMAAHYAAAERLATDSTLLRMVLTMQGLTLLNDKKDGAAALPVAERLLAVADPEDYTAFYLKGEALRLTGDCHAALIEFHKVLAKNADAVNTRFGAAVCYESFGDKANAITHYNEFVKRFPDDPRVDQAKKSLKKLGAKP